MAKVKIYSEILVPTELVEETMEYLENEGYEVEKSVPANSEWVSRLAGPGIGFLSSMLSEPIFYDIVYSEHADSKIAFDLVKHAIDKGNRMEYAYANDL